MYISKISKLASGLLVLTQPGILFASDTSHQIDLTGSAIGIIAIVIFIFAYLLVMTEEFFHLRKSKPVILAAGIIWGMIGWYYSQHGIATVAEDAVRETLLEYAELMLFLIVAMTYVNALEERRVFDVLKCWLVNRGFGFRQLFWMTGLLAFFISPIADNLTTALLMCAVVMAVGRNNARFVSLSCINIVVAANAGGAFSPFGDITTLMVWQSNTVDFFSFFNLFLPSMINFLVPAMLMHFAIPHEKPTAPREDMILLRGARRIIVLFLLTIVTAVCFHYYLGLPPVIGMLTGLGYIKMMGFYLQITHKRIKKNIIESDSSNVELGSIVPFNIFDQIARAEWDTLFFFYGVVLCVGGLGFIGYLAMISEVMYSNLGATYANISVGILSAIIDNIPVMFAVLTMHPDMNLGQWLLVTLTAGVGGSLLSIGSAAGVALMGQARGQYTFFSHLKWTPAIALGYGMSIAFHLWWNQAYFA